MTKIHRVTRTPIKACGCGRAFTANDWSKLRLVGEHLDEVERQELRDCVCGSTIAICKVRASVLYSVTPCDGGWLALRKAGPNGETIAIGVGGLATIFPSRGSAEKAIKSQKRADRAAASRLDVDLTIEVKLDLEVGA